MLTSAWTQLKPHAPQSKLWRTQARFVAVAAGRGSGKTELSRRRAVRYLCVRKPWRNPIYVYALPTYNQAKRVAWKEIVPLVPPDWIKSKNESDLSIETHFGSTLYVAGMDKPQRIEGLQIDGCVLDESCDQRPGVFDKTILPMLGHRNAWCWRIGAIKRYGVGAADFKQFYDDIADESFTWSSEDILSVEQIDVAKSIMDPRDYDEQYRAIWQRLTGGIYYCFDEVLNVRDYAYNPAAPILVGSDFNVDPMCWVLAQEKGNELYIFDELHIRNTNTQHTLNTLHSRYGSHTAGWQFYGDATARARKTSAAVSDYLQIRNDTRFIDAQCYYPKSNPMRVDRFAAVNAAYCNAKGVRRVFVHPRCVHYIKDLQARVYKPGTREPDDKGKTRSGETPSGIGHMCDAADYLIFGKRPLQLRADFGQEVYAS